MSQLKVFEPKVALFQVKIGDILAAKTDCWFDFSDWSLARHSESHGDKQTNW